MTRATNMPLAASTSATPAPSGKILSLVVPAFNEEGVIEKFLMGVDGHRPAILDALGPGSRMEIVFVDDGSTDRTAEIISYWADRRPDVVLVKLSRNFGKDIALTAGLAHAIGDAVIPMDVDLQDPPSAIPQMIEAWLGGAKVVNARRRSRSVEPWLKRGSARLFYGAYKAFSRDPVQENVGDFRLLDREVVDVVNAIPERVRFMKGLLSWVGFTQATIEYDRPERSGGQSKWAYWRLWNFALDGITGSTTLPLRIWTYLGLMLAAGSVLYAGFIIIQTLVHGVDAPGYASLMVVVLTIGAANMISLGLLGEYVGRISIEVRQRPLYVVEDIVGQRLRRQPETAEPGPQEQSPAVTDEAEAPQQSLSWMASKMRASQ